MTKLTISTKIYAPLDRVRQAWNEEQTQRCFASSERHCPKSINDLRVGGLLKTRMEAKDGSFGFDMIGQYSYINPMKEIVYTMGEMKEGFVSAGREVITQFVEDGSCGCVSLTQTFDAEEDNNLEMQQQGRQAILNNFKIYTESQSD